MALNSTHSTLITNHIVIGNRENAMDSAGLRQLGVTHVLNACVQLPNFHPQSFTYLKLDLLDNPEASITEHAKSTSSFIARAESMNGRVFCHCVSGVSRSVSVILMHLMARHRVPLREAYEHIQTLRPFIRPNEGFELQLAKVEIAQLGCSSVADSGTAVLGLRAAHHRHAGQRPEGPHRRRARAADPLVRCSVAPAAPWY